MPTALELFAPFGRAARQTEADRETLRVANELAELFGSALPAEPAEPGSASNAERERTTWVEVPVLGEVPLPSAASSSAFAFDAELARELLEMAPELAPGAQAAALRLGATMLDQAAERVAAAETEERLAALERER